MTTDLPGSSRERVPSLLRPGARVFVAGHRGLVGSAVARRLTADGHEVITRGRDRLDLRDAEGTAAFLRDVRPDAVVLAAARVGGIMANSTYPVQFIEDNLRIQLSVIAGAHTAGTERLLFLGSSCIYPKHAPQPIPESALLTGTLEPTNEAYALAKIMRHRADAVLPAPVRRLLHQRHADQPVRTRRQLRPGDVARPARPDPPLPRGPRVRRTGGHALGVREPRREFLHVDDLAAACVLLLERYDDDAPVNVGCGEDLTIRELAAAVAEVTSYQGETVWDTGKPDGTPRKLLDVSRLTSLGFAPRITLKEGIAQTYTWWLGQ